MRSVEFMGGLALGALIGAALGLLLAPQSGEEIRSQIKGRADDYKERAARSGCEILEKGKQAVLSAKEQVVASLRAEQKEA